MCRRAGRVDAGEFLRVVVEPGLPDLAVGRIDEPTVQSGRTLVRSVAIGHEHLGCRTGTARQVGRDGPGDDQFGDRALALGLAVSDRPLTPC